MHTREAIMQTIVSTVTGLVTTGTNVYRGRAYAVPAVPSLTVSQGADARNDSDSPMGQDPFGGVMRQVEVIITAHVQEKTNIETKLNQISTEVFAVIATDRTLGGLAFDTNIAAESEPDIEGGESEQPVARMEMRYTVDYQHSETTTEG